MDVLQILVRQMQCCLMRRDDMILEEVDHMKSPLNVDSVLLLTDKQRFHGRICVHNFLCRSKVMSLVWQPEEEI